MALFSQGMLFWCESPALHLPLPSLAACFPQRHPMLVSSSAALLVSRRTQPLVAPSLPSIATPLPTRPLASWVVGPVGDGEEAESEILDDDEEDIQRHRNGDQDVHVHKATGHKERVLVAQFTKDFHDLITIHDGK